MDKQLQSPSPASHSLWVKPRTSLAYAPVSGGTFVECRKELDGFDPDHLDYWKIIRDADGVTLAERWFVEDCARRWAADRRAQLSLADRARYLRKAADVIVEELDEIAELLTREQGKPITESYTMEVVPTRMGRPVSWTWRISSRMASYFSRSVR